MKISADILGEYKVNKEQTAKLIEVMQAYVDGKAIEERVHPNYTPADNWRETNFPTWNCEAYLYRVKKEPREFWAVLYDDGSTTLYNNEMEAMEEHTADYNIRDTEVVKLVGYL
jgi:hypothetical protein